MFRAVRIKDHHAEQRLFAQRAVVAVVLMLLGIGAVVSRLVWLQIVRYDYFADLSTGNRIRIETLKRLADLALIDRESVSTVKREIMARRGFDAVLIKLQLSVDELARFAVR